MFWVTSVDPDQNVLELSSTLPIVTMERCMKCSTDMTNGHRLQFLYLIQEHHVKTLFDQRHDGYHLNKCYFLYFFFPRVFNFFGIIFWLNNLVLFPSKGNSVMNAYVNCAFMYLLNILAKNILKSQYPKDSSNSEFMPYVHCSLCRTIKFQEKHGNHLFSKQNFYWQWFLLSMEEHLPIYNSG